MIFHANFDIFYFSLMIFTPSFERVVPDMTEKIKYKAAAWGIIACLPHTFYTKLQDCRFMLCP